MSLNECPAMTVDSAGWCSGVNHLPSPNHDARPDDVTVDLLVIHNISLPPSEYGGTYIADLFTNCLDCDAHPYFDRLRDLRVSSHFLIRRDGQIIQFVPVTMRAWHAGLSNFQGRERCNDFEPFANAQYQQLARLTSSLQRAVPLTAVTGHEHIAPGRKTDPGPFFDWDNYQHEYRRVHAATALEPGNLLRFYFSDGKSLA